MSLRTLDHFGSFGKVPSEKLSVGLPDSKTLPTNPDRMSPKTPQGEACKFLLYKFREFVIQAISPFS